MKWGIVEMVACTVVSGFIWNQEKPFPTSFRNSSHTILILSKNFGDLILEFDVQIT